MDSTKEEMVLRRYALGDGEGGIGTSTVRRTWMTFLAALLAMVTAMVVFSATQPQEANALSLPTTTLSGRTCNGQLPLAGMCGNQLTNAAGVSVTTCNGGTIQLTTEEKRTLDLHNQTRAANGLPSLCVHPVLTDAARSHSQEMLDKGYYDHDSYNGETSGDRLIRFGYTPAGYSYYWTGENICCITDGGSGTNLSPDSAFNGWMNSPKGHKENILDNRWREVGVGVRTGTYNGIPGSTMYTVDFGVRR